MRNPAAQDDPTASVPPSNATGWTNKPETLFVASHTQPGAALDWLLHQMRHVTRSVRQVHPEWPATDIDADFAELRAELLGLNANCEWMYRLPENGCFLAAIIAVHRVQRT